MNCTQIPPDVFICSKPSTTNLFSLGPFPQLKKIGNQWTDEDFAREAIRYGSLLLSSWPWPWPMVLKFGVFPNFEGLKVEKVFFTRAKIKPWLYFWLNLLSHNWVFEPMCHAQKHLQKEDHEDQWQAKEGCSLRSPAPRVLRLFQSLWGKVQGQEEGDGYLHQCWSLTCSCDQASSSQETEEDKALLMVFLMRIIVIFPL